MKKNSGFIELLALIIIFVVVVFYLGKDPVEIWEKIRPIFEFGLSLFVNAIDFVVKVVAEAWQKAQ
jgi:hypothetical protein